VHALDTQEGTARCIDLPGGDLSAERLTLDGSALHVGAAATIDLRTFELAKAPATPAPTPRATATPAPAKDDGGISWPPVALGLVALGALGLLARRLRPRAYAEPLDLSLRRHVDTAPAPDDAKEKAIL
jgi:hypothetical protein